MSFSTLNYLTSCAFCHLFCILLLIRIKGVSLEQYTDADILAAVDELNGRPRRKLGYRTPEELFEAFLDAVYAA